MALLVWLPLNGDLKNLGLSGLIPNSTAYISDDNGKIGKCIKTVTDSVIDLGYSGDRVNFGSISFGAWFKFNKAEIEALTSVQTYDSTYRTCSGNLIGNDSYGGIGLIWQTNDLYSGSFNDIRVFSALRTASLGSYITSSFIVPFDIWIHLFLTFDFNTRILGFWVNGELKYTIVTKTFNDATSRSLRINYNTVFGGNSRTPRIPYYINDIRIYDHCLSPKEVKEISKGLVLHYKLDEEKYNNIKQSSITNRSCTSLTYDTNTSEWTAVCPVNSSTWGVGFSISDSSIKWNYGESWIVSMEVYTPQTINWNCDINNKPDLADISSYTGNDYDIVSQRKTYTNGISSKTLLPGWNKIWFSLTASGSTYGLSNYTTNWGIVTSSLSSSITVKIKNIRGEIIRPGEEIKPGSVAIQDYSGYENNGIVIGSISSVTSPRYSSASLMNNTGTANHIETSLLSFSDNIMSVSFWVKSAKASNYVLFAYPGKMVVGQLYSSMCILPTNSGMFNLSNFKNNEWNHVVAIRNGDSYQLFINGSEETRTTTNNYYVHNGDKIWLLNRNSNNSYAANASISDVRLYVTALSEEDIKELYNTSAIVDNLGNNYCYLFEELIGNTPQALDITTLITKLGILSTGQLKEEDIQQVLISEDKYITANQLIEM